MGSYNNRVVPDRYPLVTQDFGFCTSNNAGKSPGEMGGRVTRASEPAFYADRIATKTLENKLSASGSFALTKTTAGAGIFFGFFRAEQPGASGRPINSLGMDLDCEASGIVSIYFDLRYDGRSQDFSQDPNWEGHGNHASYQSKDAPGAHDFGFSNTNFAGGTFGEVGGTFWRGGKYAYYADRVVPLSVDDRLEARGKVLLKVGGPDADMYLGWFNSTNKDKPPDEAGNFLGVHVGGPTRVGHYFQPSFTTASGKKFQAKTGPVLSQGTAYEWSLVYDPNAEDGKGAIQVNLGTESVTLPLKKGAKAEGARFDRFGLFTPAVGGQMVKIYFDDLKYTAMSKGR